MNRDSKQRAYYFFSSIVTAHGACLLLFQFDCYGTRSVPITFSARLLRHTERAYYDCYGTRSVPTTFSVQLLRHTERAYYFFGS